MTGTVFGREADWETIEQVRFGGDVVSRDKYLIVYARGRCITASPDPMRVHGTEEWKARVRTRMHAAELRQLSARHPGVAAGGWCAPIGVSYHVVVEDGAGLDAVLGKPDTINSPRGGVKYPHADLRTDEEWRKARDGGTLFAKAVEDQVRSHISGTHPDHGHVDAKTRPYVWGGDDPEYPDGTTWAAVAKAVTDEDPWSRRITEDSDDDYWNPDHIDLTCGMSIWQRLTERVARALWWVGFERR